MNREEAIRRLRYIRMDYLGYPPFLEPIDMAIEALSANDGLRCALAGGRKCFAQGYDFTWCITCPHISEEDRQLVNHAVLAIPSADDDVVRCKDCRHRDLFSCPLADNDFQKDEDFCSWGERREE